MTGFPTSICGSTTIRSRQDMSGFIVVLPRNRLRQVAPAVTQAHAARRSRSTCRNHPAIWFLAKMRLTIVLSNFDDFGGRLER
jgi:hypothetical protein